MKNIIIRIKENEDRSVIFKIPNFEQLDFELDLNSLKQGRFVISWEIKDLKKAIKENKDGKDIRQYKRERINDK